MSIMDTENVEKGIQSEEESANTESAEVQEAESEQVASADQSEQTETEEAEPLYKGKKVLKTQDELLQYVKELEEKDAEVAVDETGSFYEPKASKVSKTKAEEVKITDDAQDLSTRLLLDPESVIKEIEEKAVAKIKKANHDEKDREAAWNGFYKSNKDLEPFRDLVDMETSRLLQQWELEKKAISWKEGFSVLSTNVRSIIKRIRENESDVSEVETSRKGTGISSSGDTHVVAGAAQKKNKTFTDQLKSLQATKR